MNLRCLTLGAALALLVSAPGRAAQNSPTPAAVPASAPAAVKIGKPGPRLMGPDEMRENASQPGDLRPENAVTPQIVIPLVKKPASSQAGEKLGSRVPKPAPSGGINDAVARCHALPEGPSREACLDKIPQKPGPR
ncbi:MAG: hypothetical protein K2X42_08725 [Burkholderiaceae bacterium]|nr:hypothetical protein [Burkholderiaceae bacterium]